jgi:hypothetical protein
MPKIKVTFDEDEPIVNGKRTTPHSDGNNGRNVYIADGYVLKVDDRGYSHDDRALWKRIEKKDRKYFVPTLAQGVTEHGDNWSLQPYVELDWNITEEAAIVVSELCEKYDIRDIDTTISGSTSARNWALNAKTGDPIIFDYGLNQSSS